MTLPRSLTPDQLRRDLKAIRERLTIIERAPATSAAAVATGWTDALARQVRVTKQYTDFAGAASIVTVALGTYPAGTICTHVRINPSTPFTTTLGNDVTATVPVPTNGALADGSAKTVNLTLPDPLVNQAAALYIIGDPAAPTDFSLEITVSGGEVGNDLTAGTVVVDMLMSVPGSIADTLPHS